LNAEKAGDEKAAKAAARSEKILMGKVPLLRRRQHRANVLVLSAAGENSLGISGKEWDTKPLLGCLNGVIDRQAGEFRDGRPDDFIKKYCPVTWKGFDEPAPKWEAFLKEIMDGHLERIGFLKRVFGYIISGTCIEHIFLVLWGHGRNGKGTLIEIIAEILGAKAGPVPAEMLLQQKHPRSASAPSPEIIALMGLLLAWASEVGEGRRYDAGRLKWFSGGDSLTGREAYGSLVTFKPTHTLVLLTNYKPSGNAGDEALWARILSIRFPLKFVDFPSKPHERQINRNLREELREEAPGILAWLLAGYYEYLEKGLAPPSSIQSETDEYRRSDDSIQHFIQESCALDQGNAARAQDLFDAYESFCEVTGFKPKGKRTFFQRMEKEFDKQKDRNGIYYKGLQINSPDTLV
jgi:putative DNA primase/helicase